MVDDEEDFDFGIEASKSLQQLGAVTGVKARSELTDVRSVLQSNDVQEESEDRDGLLPSSSSCNPSPRSIQPGIEAREWLDEVKNVEGEAVRRRDEDSASMS